MRDKDDFKLPVFSQSIFHFPALGNILRFEISIFLKFKFFSKIPVPNSELLIIATIILFKHFLLKLRNSAFFSKSLLPNHNYSLHIFILKRKSFSFGFEKNIYLL